MSAGKALPNRSKNKTPILVITNEDGVTIRLPCRSLEDPTTVMLGLRKTHSWGSFLRLVVLSIFIATMVVVYLRTLQLANGHLVVAFLAPIALALVSAVAIMRLRRVHLAALAEQRTQSELQLRPSQFIVRERTPYRDRWFYEAIWPTTKRLDPLDVGRLRIEPTEIDTVNPRYAGTDTEGEIEPYLWRFLNGIGESLIADDHDGRTLGAIGHAYPRDVLTEAARKCKRLLDSYRAEYDRKLAAAQPDVKLPDYGDGIPICIGPAVVLGVVSCVVWLIRYAVTA